MVKIKVIPSPTGDMLTSFNVLKFHFMVHGVEAPITDHLGEFVPHLEKYKKVQIFSYGGR